jgi:hypothetical protein
VEEILQAQVMIDQIIIANSDAIKRIDRGIQEMVSNARKETFSNGKAQHLEKPEREEIKKCRYFDKGYCKYENKCRYFHPLEICKSHLESPKCMVKGCRSRHPKSCKWFKKEVGCKRNNCEFLHVTYARDEGITTAHKEKGIKCEGYKSTFKSENYVVKHLIRNMELAFFLNCEDWIHNKEAV